MKLEQFLSSTRSVVKRSLQECVQPSPVDRRAVMYQSFIEDQRAAASSTEASPLVQWARQDKKTRHHHLAPMSLG